MTGDKHTPGALFDAIKQMEPEVVDLSFLGSAGEAATVSIAISLKRIADTLDKVKGGHISGESYIRIRS